VEAGAIYISARVFTHTLSPTAKRRFFVGFSGKQAIENCAPPGTSPSKQISDRQKFFRSSGTDISFPSGGSSYGKSSVGSCGFGSFTLWTAPGSQPKPPPSEHTTLSDL
jgi:hypothetical protein